MQQTSYRQNAPRPVRLLPYLLGAAVATLSAEAAAQPLAPASQAEAEPAPTRPNLAVDVDIDPIAYVFKGYSVHSGLMSRKLSARVSIGAYGIETPELFHRKEGFTMFKSGFTVKADYYLGSDLDGLHFGISSGVGRSNVHEKSTGISEAHYEAKLSARVGYRLFVYRGLYINPWFGFGAILNPHDITRTSQRIEAKRWEYVPTMHFGYRFDALP